MKKVNVQLTAQNNKAIETVETNFVEKENENLLIPHQNYREKINILMRPYIEWYNENHVQKQSYDFFSEHMNEQRYDVHLRKKTRLPMWKEIIIDIQSIEEIQTNEIQPVADIIMSEFIEVFPLFKVLGAKLICEDSNHYKIQIDYKPLYEITSGSVRKFGWGHEGALKQMGMHKNTDFHAKLLTIVKKAFKICDIEMTQVKPEEKNMEKSLKEKAVCEKKDKQEVIISAEEYDILSKFVESFIKNKEEKERAAELKVKAQNYLFQAFEAYEREIEVKNHEIDELKRLLNLSLPQNKEEHGSAVHLINQ